MNFTIKQGDTRSGIHATLLNAAKTSVDLTGASVKFNLVTANQTAHLSRAAQVIDAIGGIVLFVFNVGETSEPGTYLGEFEVTYADGGVETFPNSGYIEVTIDKDLG